MPKVNEQRAIDAASIMLECVNPSDSKSKKESILVRPVLTMFKLQIFSPRLRSDPFILLIYMIRFP
jgi:hypothetical protein